MKAACAACACCGAPCLSPGWGPPEFRVCGVCGAGWLPRTPRAYGRAYFDGSGDSGVDYEGSRPQFMLIHRRRLDWLHAAGAKPGELLELGCAVGQFMEAAAGRGWRARGVEVSPYAAAIARKRFGGRVFKGTLRSSPRAWKGFDLVCGWHVLEHLRDPAGTVRGLAARLRPGGLLAWEVPDFSSRAARRGRQDWQYFLPGEHLGFYTPAGLRALHARFGLEPVMQRPTSFTRLLGGLDRAGLAGLKAWIKAQLPWFAWAKQALLWARGLAGGHDCVFVVFRKPEA